MRLGCNFCGEDCEHGGTKIYPHLVLLESGGNYHDRFIISKGYYINVMVKSIYKNAKNSIYQILTLQGCITLCIA